jgi:replicative DNA helicase
MQEAVEFQEDVGQFLSRVENGVFEVLTAAQNRGEGSVGPKDAKTSLLEWVEHIELAYRNRGKVTGIRTGLNEIDITLHGIDDSQGEICVLAGRPGQGKTALAATIVDYLGEQSVPGAVFSLEMTKQQLLDRIILGGAGLDTSLAITGFFDRSDFKRINERATQWSRYPVHFNDSSAMSTADLRAQVQVLKRKHGIRWIMVDHLHLLKGTGKQAKEDERLRLVEAMETLQFLKKQFHLAVFLMVQLNRETDRKKAGEPPVLADLSGSAAIEQYSDHVIFIHRPSYYQHWLAMKPDARRRWVEDNEARRSAHPDLWSDGSKYPDGAGDKDAESGQQSPGWARQDYEEHADLFVRKNRRGPTPQLAVRYVTELTRFSTRQAALFSNRSEDRQVGYREGGSGNAEGGKRKGSAEMNEAFPD